MTPILKRPAEARDSVRLHLQSSARVDNRPATMPEPDAPVNPPCPTAELAAAALQAEIDARREQARREGRAEGHARGLAEGRTEGYAEGRARAEQELRSAVEAQAQLWRGGIEAMQAALHQKLQALEPLAVAVGYEALVQLLGRAYAEGSGIEHSVRQLLREAEGALNLRVQLPPSHMEGVQAAFARHGAHIAPALRFEADATLGVHECRVVSERGMLETSLAQQLDAVRDALLGAVGGAISRAEEDGVEAQP